MRRRVHNRSGDRKYFRLTAQRTKAINLPSIVKRGGIRL